MYQVSLAEKREIGIERGPNELTNSQLAKDVLQGLTADQKFIPSKYFYDARGSRLFEKICLLPEYYLTRTELSLLRRKASELVDGFERGDLVELGSGSNVKICTLLEALGRDRRATTRYVPVDISETALLSAAQGLVSRYPELKVAAIKADFMRDLSNIPSDGRNLILFFGSTIGNLEEDECRVFLSAVAKNLQDGDRFLLGLDMLKPRPILEAAYNDAQQVTADFNKNVLRVLNRELDATFDLNNFEHVAFFDPDRERVEMHLRANRGLTVNIRDIGLSVSLDKGESIRTEICRKFSRSAAKKMVEDVGMRVDRWHSDPRGWFSIAEIVGCSEGGADEI
jgi:L-histidine N-alpha-methyltransferase